MTENLTKCSVCGWEWDGQAQCDHRYGDHLDGDHLDGDISNEELYKNISIDYVSPPPDPVFDGIYIIWSKTKKDWEQELKLLFELTQYKQNNIPIIDNYMTLFSLRSGQIQEELKAWIYHYGNENILMSDFNHMRQIIENYLDRLSAI